MDGSISLYTGERFALRPDKEEIYGWLELSHALPAFAAYEAAWDEAGALFEASADISCCIHIEKRQAATVFFTLGGRAEREVEAAFSRGDYVTGTLINSMADQAVFRSDALTGRMLRDVLAESMLYADRRMEAPFDYPAAEHVRLIQPMLRAMPDVRVLCSGLFSPCKSMMYRVTLSEVPGSYLPAHDCSRCSRVDCPYRGLRRMLTAQAIPHPKTPCAPPETAIHNQCFPDN